MRKIILSAGITLDGYIARPDGDVDFLFIPKDYSMSDFFARIDTTIMGRKTYEVSLKMGGGSFGSPQNTYVMSRTLEPGTRDGVTITRETPAALVERIRKKPGKDAWLMGGGQLTRDFLAADLVDEIHLGVVPLLLGAGLPLFPPGFQQQRFDLIEHKSYAQGLLTLVYRRARQ